MPEFITVERVRTLIKEQKGTLSLNRNQILTDEAKDYIRRQGVLLLDRRLRRPIIAGNWKMNGDPVYGSYLAREINRLASEEIRNRERLCDIILFPPFVSIMAVAQALKGTSIKVGAQNLHHEAKGAFTGEISGSMLRAAGASVVLVGHSERREYSGEDDSLILAKTLRALSCGLEVILCIGETLEERKNGKALETVCNQLASVLPELPSGETGRVTLAYEPRWAIGTGVAIEPAQAEEMHLAIREKLVSYIGRKNAEHMRILYGGSVKPDNAFPLAVRKGVDGFLVGAASLEARTFVSIIKHYLEASEKEIISENSGRAVERA